MRGAKIRLCLHLDPALAARIDTLAARRGWTKSAIAEAAFATFFEKDAGERLDGALSRRLDRQSRQLDRLAHDQTLAVEALALFIRHWLTVTPPLPSDLQAVGRAKGRERYEAFIEALVRRMGGVHRFGQEVERAGGGEAGEAQV